MSTADIIWIIIILAIGLIGVWIVLFSDHEQ